VSSAGQAAADPVDATGKGIAGGALLGGELLVLTGTAVGISTPWLYAVGAGVGAGGGAVGGYFVEKSAGAELSLYMLLGGMALIIPTSIAYLNAVAYSPESDLAEDNDTTPVDVNVDESAASNSTAPVASARSVGSRGPAVFNVSATQVSVAVPNITVSDIYSRTELVEHRLKQRSQFNVPLLTARF
jgi:hypothetical protein